MAIDRQLAPGRRPEKLLGPCDTIFRPTAVETPPEMEDLERFDVDPC